MLHWLSLRIYFQNLIKLNYPVYNSKIYFFSLLVEGRTPKGSTFLKSASVSPQCIYPDILCDHVAFPDLKRLTNPRIVYLWLFGLTFLNWSNFQLRSEFSIPRWWDKDTNMMLWQLTRDHGVMILYFVLFCEKWLNSLSLLDHVSCYCQLVRTFAARLY